MIIRIPTLLARIPAALLALAVLYAGAAQARVDNFVLLDHHGEAFELYYQSDASAIVLIVQGNSCPVVRASLPDFRALRDEYAERGVRVLMINSNLQDTRQSIAAEAREWDIDFPVLDDSAQIIGQSLALERTGEVLVIDPASWEIVYRGALNNRVDYERQKNEADQHYVRDVLDTLLAGETPTVASVNAPGCIINYPNRDTVAQISYSEDIAPILQENCMACHIEGGIAPWAMSEYRMVQGFAPMMREVIRTRRMPPWHADPEIGHWVKDGGMSDADTAMLVSWIEAGAPRGDGPDPLKAGAPVLAEWPLGEPDLVLTVPAFEVPASGVVDYQYPAIANPLDRDVWVVAATINPGDTRVVHHVLMGSGEKPPTGDARESVFDNYIMGYAPGNESSHMPEGTGVFVPRGGYFLMQMHYTPVGKAISDETRVGLYFADEPPANFLRQQVVLNPRISIPPNAPAHEETAYFEFWHDAVIYSLVPHAHYRGRSSKFELVYPDGEREVILSVPDYDFNWQRTYSFQQPKTVPAGTRIVHTTVYDNSARNPGNPDPQRRVPWGLQSWDEMLYGSVTYSWVQERSDAPIHSRVTSETAQWMGFVDADMDGLVQKEEMSPRLQESIGWRWRLLDRDNDGGLNLKEMQVLMERLMQASAEEEDSRG